MYIQFMVIGTSQYVAFQAMYLSHYWVEDIFFPLLLSQEAADHAEAEWRR